MNQPKITMSIRNATLDDHAAIKSLLVYESEVNFITQLVIEGDFARISYFAVDPSTQGQDIGQQMEVYCEQLARNRKCERIEVHCHECRTDALRFYQQQSYTGSPRYLVKSLT